MLDEPTFGQDANTWAELASFLSESAGRRNRGRPVTHDQEFSAVLGGTELRLGPEPPRRNYSSGSRCRMRDALNLRG